MDLRRFHDDLIRQLEDSIGIRVPDSTSPLPQRPPTLSSNPMVRFNEDSALLQQCFVLSSEISLVHHQTKRTKCEQLLSLSSIFLKRLALPDSPFAFSRTSLEPQVLLMRAKAFRELQMASEAKSEIARILEMPDSSGTVAACLELVSIHAQAKQLEEMRGAVEKMERLVARGIGVEFVTRVASSRGQYESLKVHLDTQDDAEAIRVYNQVAAVSVASLTQGLGTSLSPVVYCPELPIATNVRNLFTTLEHHLLEVRVSSETCFRTSCDDLGVVTPLICSSRTVLDALVHLCFADDPRQRFSALANGKLESRIAVGIYADKFRSLGLATSLERDLVTDILHFIEQGSVVVAYHLILDCEICEDCVMRWVFRSEGVAADRRLCSKRTRETLHFFHSCFDDPPAAWFRNPAVHEACRVLYDLLMVGIEPYLGKGHVTIVPDRHLFRVPFACLLDSDGKYFIEKHSFSISNSLKLMNLNAGQKERILMRPSPSHVSLLVCGDSRDEHFAFEVNELVRIGSKLSPEYQFCVPLCCENFNPESLKVVCTSLQPRVVHVVGHADSESQENEPFSDILDSYRLCGAIQTGKGMVYAKSFSTFNLEGTDLVFLNCCSLADGHLLPVGILGFVRACFVAGSPSVISALWPTSDMISFLLSSRFYQRYLDEALDKAESLRAAILEVMDFPIRGAGRVRDYPLLWGSYQLFGNPV